MKEHKSHMNMVARFAYIFATIVTIFAQMGLAPLIATQAVVNSSNPALNTTQTSYTADEPVYLTVNGGTDSGNVKLQYDTNILDYVAPSGTYDGHVTNDENKGTVTIDPYANFIANWPVKLEFKVKAVPDNNSTVISAVDPGFSNKILKSITVGIENAKDDGSTSGTTDSSDSVPGGLQLSVLDDGPTTYDLNNQVNLQLRDDLSKKPAAATQFEIGINTLHLTDYLDFDSKATAELLRSRGYTQKGMTTNDDGSTTAQSGWEVDDQKQAYTLTGNSHNIKVYSYVNTDGSANDFSIWQYPSGEIHFVWSNSATTTQTGFVAMRAERVTAPLSGGVATLTPAYMSADENFLSVTNGNGVGIKINDVASFEGKDFKMEMRSIAPDNKGAIYPLSSIPLYYVTTKNAVGDTLYSFVHNDNNSGFAYADTGKTMLEQYRYAVINKLNFPTTTLENAGPYGTAAQTSDLNPAFFENFAKVNADGTQDADTLTHFQVNTEYSLNQIDPVKGQAGRFYRMQTRWLSSQYYMPDGLPTFKISKATDPDTGNIIGKITLGGSSDGNAVPGQWGVSDDGSTIQAHVYKIKHIQVIDDQDKGVANAKVEMTGTGTHHMQVNSTDASGIGDMVPDDYEETSDGQGPFYLANGTQTFAKLDLPTGYEQLGDIGFNFTVNSSTDKLDVNALKGATLSEDGQTLIIKVHKVLDADTQLKVQKVDAADKTLLKGATFEMTEIGNATDDGVDEPELTSDEDGVVMATVSPTSTAKTRLIHIKEMTPPTGYDLGASDGYYALWTKGIGFTAVGQSATATPTATNSDDNLASVSGGVLTIADHLSKLKYGGNASTLTMEYISADQTPIEGAQLPVLDDNKAYGVLNGVGGVIYNSGNDPTKLTTPDAGLVAGTGLNHTSSMALSTEKSDANGLGLVQTLWSQLGLDAKWSTLYTNDQTALNVANAMVNGTIPADPVMAYSLITPVQQARAPMGTTAQGYYSLGGSIAISGGADGKINGSPATGANKFNTAARDNQAVVNDNKLQVTLFKVKHVKVIDANESPIKGVTVRFSDMASGSQTDQYGDAELVPVDANGDPSTSFVFPDAYQSFKSAKVGDQDLDLGSSPTDFKFRIADAADDKLYSPGDKMKNIYLSDDGQTVILKTNTAQTKTVINIHKQSAFDKNTPVVGVTFKVTSTDGTSVTTAATDSNGDTQATFDIASSDKKYTIQELDVPTGLNYKKDTETHTFTADATGQVTDVSAGDTVISVGADKVLHFADTPTGGGGVGDNGTNGGELKIRKVDQADGNIVQSDATKFTITQTMPSTGYSESQGTTNGVAKFKVGDPTASDKVFKIVESNAPDGYEENTKIYALRIQKDGTMTLGDYPALNTDITADHTSDGTITFAGEKDHTLVFRDTKKQTNNGFSIKKTEATDPTKGVTGNATFTVERLDPTTRLDVDAYTIQTTDGTTLKTVLTDQSLTNGIFSIHEKTAPSGYVADNNTYYFSWNSVNGVTGLTSDRKATSMTDQTIKNSAGQQVLGIEGGVLNFSDVKQPTTGPVLTVKKVIKGTTTGLPGATFKVTDIGNGNTNAPTGGDTRGSVVTPLTSTTDSNGTQQFSITATPAGTLQRVFEIVETKAPDGYALNSTPYYVTWNDTSGVGGVSISPTKAAGFAGTADGVATWIKPGNKILNSVSIGDSPNFFKVAAVQRTATSGDAGKTVGNVSVKLSDPTGKNGTPQTVTTNSVSGTVNVNTDTVAKALGLSTAQMTGSVDLRIDVSNSSNLTSPVSRIVRFTFPGSKDPAGFAVYGGVAAADSTNALKTFDGMVEDSKANGLKIASGDLDLLLRKDTLNAFSISDTNVSGVGLANVSYTVTFNANGKSYSKKVTTSTSGQFVLPDPNTLLGVKDFIAPGGTAQVTIKQNTPLSGYATNETTATLLYRTGYGYYSLMGDAKTGIDNTQTSTVLNGTVMSMQSILYYFGDSSINFYLTKELGDLNLASVPESMNFGQVKPGVLAQDYPLLNVGDANEAAFDTSSIGLSDPNVSTSEDNGVMSAKVIQQGTYDDGWKLQLLVGDLISEDKKSTVSGGSITFANYPTILKDDTDAGIADAGLTGYPSLMMGTADATDMLSTGPNAQAGTYLVNMKVSDVKINIPDNSGMPNTNYQAPMTWTIDDTPQTDVGSN